MIVRPLEITKSKYYSDIVIDKIHHVYATPFSRRTFCKRRFLKFGKETGWIKAKHVFAPGYDVWFPLTMCEECIASEEFQERHALFLLAEVGEDTKTPWLTLTKT